MSCYEIVFEAFNAVAVVVLAVFSIWMRSKLIKGEFTYSVRFKHEFEIYKYVWLHASHFAREAKSFYQPRQSPTSNPTEMAIRMGPMFREEYEVKETLLNNAPFISDKVGESARYLIELMIPPNIAPDGFDYNEYSGEVDMRLATLKRAIEEQTIKNK